MLKQWKKIIAVFVSITMLLTSISMETMAETISLEPAVPSEEAVASTTTESDNSEVTVIGELVEKREANIKHYRMSDGTNTAAVYPQEIHYEDENGSLVDIDNSFTSVRDGTDDVFANKKNEFQVKFMKKSNKNKLYTINKGKEKIKVSIEGISKVKAEIRDDFKQTGTLESDYGLLNISSAITYSNVFDNVDLEYTVVSKEIKENIILKKAVDFDHIVYNYQFGNHLEAVQQDSQTILLRDKNNGEIALEISAPVMWDSAGNYYDKLAITILNTQNGKASIELQWDEKVLKKAKYPVTIDPVLSFSTNRYEIQDTYIVQSAATTNYNYNDHLKLRNDGYMLLEFPTPAMTSGDKIVYAELILTPYMFLDGATNDYSNANSYNPALYITSHKILRSWDENTVTYQNANAGSGFYDSTAYSYRILDGDNDFYRWDITRLANEWTEGGIANHGVLLRFDKTPSDGSIANAFFCSTNGRYNPVAYYPQILYQYINTSGIENYFSYHTQNLGYAGTAYTNDMTGNLTIINPVVQTGGFVMPITVSLVYNTNDVSGNGKTLYGNGWKLNWSQKIDRTIEEDFGYTIAKYIDGDGTQHYFKYNETTGVFTDEIDPKRRIIWSDVNTYALKDDEGNFMLFKRSGTSQEWYLTQVMDCHGNYIRIELDPTDYNKITQLTSSTGNEIRFAYDSNGILNKIKYYDGNIEKEVTLSYINHITANNNCLSTITYADNTKAEYNYHSNASYLSKAIDIDGSSMAYGYAWNNVVRVTSITEYSTANEQGQSVAIAYQSDATTITDITNGRKYLYTFATTGTLKSVVDITENDGNGYGQYYEYNNGNTTSTQGKGNLTFVSKTQKSAVNILRDHSFENGLGLWSYQAWKQTAGSSNAVLSTTTGYLGKNSYQLYRSADCNATRVLAYNRINVTLGKKYTLSAYINTKDMISLGSGASVYVAGEYFEFESEIITETSNKWQRVSVTFISPITGKASICMSMQAASGYAYFDCVQIEEGDLSDYNLLENAGFEGPFGKTAEGWGSYTGENFLSSSEYAGGNYAINFKGEPDKDNEYQQVIYTTGNAGDTFVASVFAKADSAPAEGWQFTLMVRFVQWGTYVNTVVIPLNAYTTEWQKVSGVAKAEGNYTAIVFYLLYCENVNDVYFDNAQLTKDSFGSTYTYDSKGNLISTVDLQGREEYTFQYDGNNQLIKQTNVSGGSIEYTYNTNVKQQLDAVSSGGVTTGYTYDSRGNVLTSTTRGSDSENGPSIMSSATYSNNGEYMKTATDSRGNTTQYEYHETRGYVDYTTAPDGSVTDYTYNGSELLTNVSMTKGDATSSVAYGYNGIKQLTSILSPSGTTYGFVYDTFGRNTDIKIGQTRTLSSYDFDNKDLLEQLIYGNGTVVSYDYDNLNRQTETTINDVLRYQYTYDGSSRLLEVMDILGGKKIRYNYDILDRFVSESIFDTITNKTLADVSVRYDNAKNRVSGYDVEMGSVQNSTDYIYGELTKAPDIITGVKQNGTRTLSYGYDTLNRLVTRTLATTTPFVTEYGYQQGATTDTTTVLVKTVKNGSDTLEYAYDVLGNITSVSKNGSVVESYTYDYLNQLKTVTRGNDTYTYTYDNGGNLLAVALNGETIKSYIYGDNEWKDLLTAYNGENITYDTIGNPLTYRAGMNFTWTDGRKLSGITKGTDNISYTYDANGLRNSKIVNGTATDYYWLNGMLQGQKTGNEYILFLYDESGSAYGFILQNETEQSYYYYEFNLQGDIIGIVNSDGTKVVEYTYDEWGKILSITGTLADTIGQKNPLRYRGYYYDAETGFYYLNSRYYDVEICRFLNADGLIDNRGINTYNLFQYCGNNPVNNADPNGNLFGAIVVGLVIVGLVAVLSGCSSKKTTSSSTAPKPKPQPKPTEPEMLPLTEDEKVLIATIAAEATVTAQGSPVSSAGRQAMANVALNRVGSREWSKYNTVAEICQYTGFDGYGDKNYWACMEYLNSRDGNNATYEAIIWDVMAAYETDITRGCQLYYTPAAMQPAGSEPNWNFSILTEVIIPGVDTYYEGRFFRY